MDLISIVQSGDDVGVAQDLALLDRVLSTLPPDVLFDIATHLDYRSVIRLCRVSRIFNQLFCQEDDSLWRILYQRDISKYRPPQVFWTRRTKGPSKSQQSHNYRRDYYEIIQAFENLSPNDMLVEAASEGYEGLVKQALDKGATAYDIAMVRAAQKGYKDIVEMMLKLGADAYNWAMEYAASGGHHDVIDLIEKYQ